MDIGVPAVKDRKGEHMGILDEIQNQDKWWCLCLRTGDQDIFQLFVRVGPCIQYHPLMIHCPERVQDVSGYTLDCDFSRSC